MFCDALKLYEIEMAVLIHLMSWSIATPFSSPAVVKRCTQAIWLAELKVFALRVFSGSLVAPGLS